MLIPNASISIIKEFEGLYLEAYPDPKTNNLPITIGYGCTEKLDGTLWHLGDTITEEQADQYLITQLETTYLPKLQTILTWILMNDNQQSAIISFSYNEGQNFYNSPGYYSMTKLIDNPELWSDINYVTSTFVKYRNPGSSVEAGLRRRREAEAKLFLTK